MTGKLAFKITDVLLQVLNIGVFVYFLAVQHYSLMYSPITYFAVWFVVLPSCLINPILLDDGNMSSLRWWFTAPFLLLFVYQAFAFLRVLGMEMWWPWWMYVLSVPIAYLGISIHELLKICRVSTNTRIVLFKCVDAATQLLIFVGPVYIAYCANDAPIYREHFWTNGVPFEAALTLVAFQCVNCFYHTRNLKSLHRRLRLRLSSFYLIFAGATAFMIVLLVSWLLATLGNALVIAYTVVLSVSAVAYFVLTLIETWQAIRALRR